MVGRRTSDLLPQVMRVKPWDTLVQARHPTIHILTSTTYAGSTQKLSRNKGTHQRIHLKGCFARAIINPSRWSSMTSYSPSICMYLLQNPITQHNPRCVHAEPTAWTARNYTFRHIVHRRLSPCSCGGCSPGLMCLAELCVRDNSAE